MKLNRLVSCFAIPLTVSILAISTVSALANQVDSQMGAEAIVAPDQVAPDQVAPDQVAQSQSVAISAGTFVAAEHPTAGSARIVEENGHRYLEFDAAFSTDQGPDLHVLLDKTVTPPQSYMDTEAGRYVNLGGLKAVNGTQRYPIPDEIQVGNYQSVAVWCRMANATFGYAPLQPTGAASLPQ